MFRRIAIALAFLLSPLLAQAQNTVTLGASVTSGNGSLSTVLTWATNPVIPTGTPCTASGDPGFTGPKPDHGTTTILISQSGTFTPSITCTFSGDSIVTFSWTPATKNTDNSNYTNPQNVRIKYIFAPTLDPNPTCIAGETCVDVPDPIALRPTMRTVTGIVQTGTLRAEAFHQNTNNAYSVPSNAATKVFTGSVPVTQSVTLTVNPLPGPPSAFGAI